MSIDLKDVKKGQILWECQSGFNIRVEAQEDARKKDNGWACNMKLSRNGGEILEYYWVQEYAHYGPRLYKEPQYIPLKHCMSEDDFNLAVSNGEFNQYFGLDKATPESYRCLVGELPNQNQYVFRKHPSYHSSIRNYNHYIGYLSSYICRHGRMSCV